MKFRLAILSLLFIFTGSAFSQLQMEIPDSGWRLWPDTAAQWENDALFLPDEVNLPKLPSNPPSGGWKHLNQNNGIALTLPSTVEKHFWGEFGFRDYGTDGYFGLEEPDAKNGNYRGVSWWWTEIDIPQNYRGKKILLHLRSARQRAEIYLNQKLVGYHLIGETAYQCDISTATRPGRENLLAIRITNPGGEMDWLDTRYLSWGEYRFHSSHGFGGLDRGLRITAHDPLYISDLWVANTPEINSIKAHLEIRNESQSEIEAELHIDITGPGDADAIIFHTDKKITIPAVGKVKLSELLNCPTAKLWDPGNPNLYLLRVRVRANPNGRETAWQDISTRTFGFRWFAADGIGENAVLRLNGRRIRLISAISWGFWGMNGLWPSPMLAEKEVLAAKSFGMNCLQFHRNIGKTEVFEAQDRLGLLRYMEPGGGQQVLGEKFKLYADSPSGPVDISGDGGEAGTFAEKYMEEKLIRMIRDHRSHPSLIIYGIQNEIHPDLQNPRIFRVLRRMHAEDPSRILVLKSGIPPQNQVWMQPYSDLLFYDRGDGYSGWWDQHTVGGPGVWQDNMYRHPRNFTHRSENDKEIAAWGEMLGAAVPDNHPQIIRQIEAAGGKSYDIGDHREIARAYENFIDRWKFRKSFPTGEALFLNIGDKSYDFWGRVIETARLAEANDFLVISGWESTAIENHSGLLDNLRNFKGNPALLKDRLSALRPVIRARSLVVAAGQPDTLDLFLLNETNAPAGNRLTLTMISPTGTRKVLGNFTVPAWEKDRFVYPVVEGLITPPLEENGFYELQFSLHGENSAESSEKILAVQTAALPSGMVRVGVLSPEPALTENLNAIPGIQAAPYSAGGDYQVVVASTRLLHGWRSEVAPDMQIENTEDDELYRTESWGYWQNLEYVFYGLPAGTARVTLRLAEVTLKRPGDRVMNVAINGDTVLSDFDIVKTVGGPAIALDTAFTVPNPDGVIKITVPKLTVNYAKFSAIKIEAGDTVIAINCGGEEYTDKNGLVWKKYGQRLNLDEALLRQVGAGLPLLLLPDGSEAAEAYARMLGKAGAFDYQGHVGNVRASWMGSWFFVRENPVFDCLPVNQALKSYYQVPVSGSDGILLDGEGVEVFAGYSRDHDRNIGAAVFTAGLGRGRLLFFTLPGMVSGANGIHPVIRQRLLANAISYLATGK